MSKQFCLKWNNFQTNILHAFESLQTSEDLTDVTLSCEGINIKAHKFILSACSPYFRSVFKENPCPHPIVILKDVLYIDLITVINFMYHGEVLVAEEQLNSFLETAQLLHVTGLDSINEDNCTKQTRKSKVLPHEHDTAHKRPKLVAKSAKLPSSDCLEQKLAETGQTEDEVDDKPEPASLLEAALEKSESILQRSLISGKSPVPAQAGLEPVPEASKSVFILRKPPESASSSPIDRPGEETPPAIKIEDESLDALEATAQKGIGLETPSHHSSQCGNCPHCGKIYSNQSSLKYHVRLVHSDLTNMYCCHLCPEVFSYREGYKKHMVEAHCVRN